MAANNLQRKSTGLQPGHRGLIRILAEIAVDDYLRELEAAETAHTEQHHMNDEELDTDARD